MNPYHQGSLDSLCGVYAIVNAAKRINRLNDKQSQRLFNDIIRYLDKEGRLVEIILEGSLCNLIQDIIDNSTGRKICNFSVLFEGVPTPNLDEYWNLLVDLEKKYCDKKAGKNGAIIIELGGIHEHWSVIDKITPRQIRLYDSESMKTINRSKCTTSKKLKRHDMNILYPAQTIFLVNSSVDFQKG
jgi:hypothetical protein